MSSEDVAKLMEMGASRPRALHALSRHKEVMEAAEALFSGVLDDIDDEDEIGDVTKGSPEGSEIIASKADLSAPNKDDFEGEDVDSEYDDISIQSEPDCQVDCDPYKGLNLSKDRSKTVIELEEISKEIELTIKGSKKKVRQMTQAQWMKGCPEGSEQNHLFGLYQGLAGTPFACPTCGMAESRGEASLLVFLDSVEEYLDFLEETVQRCCSRCQTRFCAACRAVNELGSKLKDDKGKSKATDGLDSSTSRNQRERDTKLLHCSELQAAILGVGLAHVEELLDRSDAHDPSKSPSLDTTAKRRRSQVESNCKGTGYAGDQKDEWHWHAKQKEKQAKLDKSFCDSLKALREYLPNTCRQSTVSSDYLPHVGSIAQIRRRFLPIVSRLLQSDSLHDMSERFELFQEVVGEWFKAFAVNEALLPLLAQPIMLIKSVRYTVRKETSREKHVTYEGSEGPRELAQSIVLQCKAFLDNLDRHHQSSNRQMSVQRIDNAKENANDDTKGEAVWLYEEQRLQSFAKYFIDDVANIDRILRNTKGDAFVDKLIGGLQTDAEPTTAQSTESVAVDVDLDEITAYEMWAKSQCFDECNMRIERSSSESETFAHAYSQDISLINASSNHKRGFIIAKELASLRVSLPTFWNGSIFLRVDESRIDVLKACIVGPEGSPYQNGLFMFDILLPSTYNHTNPLVKIVTTANGTVRFNPNLYANGKVCLSLLGTWTGPGWKSGQSTLLQVLISIQSLVMGVEEPALNEPGWSSQEGEPGSIAYSKNCRRQTVTVAMLRHLNDPLDPWKEVIKGHFRLKANSISAQLDKWLREDDGNSTEKDGVSVMHNYNTRSDAQKQAATSKFEKDVNSIKKLLKKLA